MFGEGEFAFEEGGLFEEAEDVWGVGVGGAGEEVGGVEEVAGEHAEDGDFAEEGVGDFGPGVLLFDFEDEAVGVVVDFVVGLPDRAHAAAA